MSLSAAEPDRSFAGAGVVRRARRTLCRADESMGAIIKAVGPFKPDLVDRPFEALVLSVIHQQLSMKAARTIAGRVRALCPRKRLAAARLRSLSDAQLRSAGLSRQKVDYLRSICVHERRGRLRRGRLGQLGDDAVIQLLTEIKGVGVWTAEMILIFCLQRTDVWPVDDLGLRHALKKWYRLPLTAKRDRLLKRGEGFRPYRSIATWYLWRSLGGDIVPGFK